MSDSIVLIEISDDTLKNLGNWPLPRDFHTSLLEVLKDAGAKAIIFDIIFSEPTKYDSDFAQAIQKAGDVYLPLVFYINDKGYRTLAPPKGDAILTGISKDLWLPSVKVGHINVFVDPDGKLRRIPLFIEYNQEFYPHIGFKAACDWLGLNNKNIEFKRGRVIIDNRLSLPILRNCAFMVNYPENWEKSFRHLSYFDILKSYTDSKLNRQPLLDLSIIKDKVCFIGLTATGTPDLKPTPLENIYPMLGLQASVFNSIIQGKFIIDAGLFFNILISILVFIFSLILCLRLSPVRAFIGSIAFGGVYFIISVALFIFLGIWIALFLPLVIIGLTYIGSTSYRFFQETQKRQILEKELDIALSIQKSFLPGEIRKISGLDIFPFIQPAKFVAGDFYDILPIDDKRMGVFIGDVAGKGVPAALIMAQTISLFRVFSRQYLTCSEVLTCLNREFAGKFDSRFVTALYMIADLDKHKIRVSSAGHGPLLIYKKKENRILEMEFSSGMPLGIMEGTEYKDREFDIENGDGVIVFTDGITEARNKEGSEFGVDKIKDLVLENAACGSQIINKRIKDAVMRFSYPLPQYDDITLIVMSFNS